MLREQFEQWQSRVESRGVKERKQQFATRSKIPIRRLYTPLDLEAGRFDYLESLNFPGEYPYTRGIEPGMYRENLWLIGQYGGFGLPEETNQRFKYLLGKGITAFTLALDLPTQMGYGSDDPMSEGEVGKTGVAVNSFRDMESIFEGIPLDSVRLIGTLGNAISPMALSWFMALAERQNVAPTAFIGFLQNDILKEYVARGAYFLPVHAGLKLTIDVLEYCARNFPNWLPLMVCGYHFRDAGATAIQELAFTVADAIAYIEKMIERGFRPDDFVRQFQFHFSAHLDLFEECAKFRAFRRIWARLMSERYGARDPGTLKAKIHLYTAGSTLTAQQPMNNIVRITVAALSAILGGVQFPYLSSMDESFQTPSEEAAQLAIRTQQILAHEVGITETVDPLGGSYYVETLTNQLEEAVWEYLAKIESMGGAVRAIEQGFYQTEIAKASYQQQKEVEQQERIVVGVNAFKADEEVKIVPLRYDPDAEQKIVARLRAFRDDRPDPGGIAKALDGIRRAARAEENVVPSVFEAVRKYATVGEIGQVLREVYGEYTAEKTYF